MEFEVTVRIKAPSMAIAIARLNVALNELPKLAENEVNRITVYKTQYDSIESEILGLVAVEPRIVNAKEVSENA